MKIRNGYVSNSSSSSFVIYNWFDISEDKRLYIKNYDENSFDVWKKKKLEFISEGTDGVVQEFPFYGKEIHLKHSNINSKYNFGYLNDGSRWHFYENKIRNTCTVETSMDNFNMDNWLKYNKLDFEQLYPMSQF